jgi:holo-[acyl-carrier protein] synthase
VPATQTELCALSIKRVERLILRYPRIETRFFTAAEVGYCRRHKRNPFQHFAVRLAAKFVVRRFLGHGRLKEIELAKVPGGAPRLVFTGSLAGLETTREFQISLSHEGDLAVAFVALEGAV